MRLLVPVMAVGLLAGLIVSLTTPHRASAAVEDYKPATYNMQGGTAGNDSKWTTDIMQLINGGYNVISLQETGPRPPSSAQLAYDYGLMGGTANWTGWHVSRYTWDPYPRSINPLWNIYWVRTDFSGPGGTLGGRVNLAIVTPFNAASVLLTRPAFYNNNGVPTSRPALGIRLGQNDLFFTVHALSPNGNDGSALLSRISSLAGQRNWAAMGDWNRDPGRLAIQPGMHKYTSNGATHIGANGNNLELDYMVSNNRIAGYGGVSRGFSSDHLAVGFRRLAANAEVQLLNAHDGNRALEVESANSSTDGSSIVSEGTLGAGPYGHFKFVPAGDGNYTIRITKRDANYSEMCLDAVDTRLRRYSCDGTASQRFTVQYWSDTGQLRLKPVNRSTCLGDDTDFGWGSEIVTTMSCSKGEARFNFRFDRDPGPNAPLVV
ncbi:hypothetical protein ACIRQQ_34450 [Streptomyces fuscichromogenes]|uniref:hypothetical protein n=1 Tax=Streptomyces fuscichromogenes TaxID=1324013 RepID=UPI00381A1370